MNYNLGKIVSLDFVKSNHSTKIDLKLKKKIQSNNCYFRIQVRVVSLIQKIDAP